VSTTLDHSFGIGLETTFGTQVTPTRWYEILPDSELEFDPEPKQGQGLRVGSIVPRSGRRRAGLGMGTCTVQVEILSQGPGLLWSACIPTYVSNLVSGATYQQLGTMVQTTPFLPSFTIQAGIVDAAGTVRPHTFAGCTVSSWTLTIPQPDSDDAVVLEVEFDMRRAPDVATALTTPVMPSAGATIYVPRDVSSVTYGGTVTVPTTTALASGGTAISYSRAIEISCDNALGQRPNHSAYARPTAGKREIAISLDAEFAAVALRDAYLAQDINSFGVTLTTPEALDAGFETLQLIAPATAIDEGGVPTYADGETVVQEGMELAVLDNTTQAPLYVVTRTLDNAA
jgi:hypothetical protein